MNDLNQCQFIGRLGADPEIRRTQDGRPIANLRLAVGQSWKDRNTGEKREKTEWVPVVIFNEGLCKVAENWLKKGSQVFIQGQFQTRKWQDKDGNDRWTSEIVLQGYDSALQMIGGAPSGGSNDRAAAADDFGSSSDLDDEIPF